MVKCPQILTLHLKRFDTNALVKSHHSVDVPPELQLKAGNIVIPFSLI